MSVLSDAENITLLNQLEHCVADDLESLWLDFKPWTLAKEDREVTHEYAVEIVRIISGNLEFLAAPTSSAAIAFATGDHENRGIDNISWSTNGMRFGKTPVDVTSASPHLEDFAVSVPFSDRDWLNAMPPSVAEADTWPLRQAWRRGHWRVTT